MNMKHHCRYAIIVEINKYPKCNICNEVVTNE